MTTDTPIKRGTAKRLGLRGWRRIKVMVAAIQCDGCRAVEPAPDGELPAGWRPSADFQGDFCPACIAAEPSPIVFPVRSGVDTP
jgi:hypothetical protein